MLEKMDIPRSRVWSDCIIAKPKKHLDKRLIKTKDGKCELANSIYTSVSDTFNNLAGGVNDQAGANIGQGPR